MKLNSEQSKYLADILKIVAVAQFALFGYTGLVDHVLMFTIGSGLLFALLIFFGLYVLDGEHDD